MVVLAASPITDNRERDTTQGVYQGAIMGSIALAGRLEHRFGILPP